MFHITLLPGNGCSMRRNSLIRISLAWLVLALAMPLVIDNLVMIKPVEAPAEAALLPQVWGTSK